MSAAAKPVAAASPVDQLRLAVSDLFGAERRLRGRDHSRPGELTHAQLRALAALGREHEMSAGELARSADLNPASVTALLDQLEDAAVVKRRRSSTDRRVCIVSLTAQGEQLLERKLSYWYGLWEEQLAGLPASDLQAAARVLEQVTAIYQDLVQR